MRSGVAEGLAAAKPPSRVESHMLVAFPYAPHIRAGRRRPSMGFGCPTTLAEAGSDLHQACLTWLCCAFRLSQPLDALFHPQPLRPCFMPVTPLGFRFRRVSLTGSGRRLSTPPSLRAVSMTGTATCQGRTCPGLRLQGFAHPTSPYRPGRCYPGSGGRSSHSVRPLRGLLPIGLGSMLPRSLLSWALPQP
jgi:hypothetical protein